MEKPFQTFIQRLGLMVAMNELMLPYKGEVSVILHGS
jgi:hypothetical protein